MIKTPLFLVQFYVKPYVWKYLNDNFGIYSLQHPHLVDLRPDPSLYRRLIEGLYQSSGKVMATPTCMQRTEMVEVKVSFDTWQRYGWTLTEEADRQLNIMLEQRCKIMMLTYVSMLYGLYGNLARSIQEFYERFGYNDDIWSVEAIRKTWQREKILPKVSFLNEIKQQFSSFFLEKMSKDGTITKQGLNAYENN